MKTKHWFTSKTLWLNVIVLGGIIAQEITGVNPITPEIQVMILAIINIILRKVTDKPIGW